MSLQNARMALLDSQSLEAGSSDEFQLKIDATGDLTKGAGGVKLAGTLTNAYTFTTVAPQSTIAPTNANDLVRKSDLDALSAGLKWKAPVEARSTANISIASAPATLDGVLLAINDRILLVDQTALSENGIWQFNGSGAALTRPSDFATGADAASSIVTVKEGATHPDKIYQMTGDSPTSNIDTHNLNWSEFSGGGGSSITAGAGCALSGSTLNVGAADTSMTINADDLAVNLNASQSGLDVLNGLRISTAAAGNGLAGGGAAALSVDAHDNSVTVAASGISVNVDGTTLTTTAGGVGIPAEGITSTQIAASVAGNGLSGGNGSALAIIAGDNSITVGANDIAVNISATAPGIETTADGIRINAAAAGAGLTGGGGAALEVDINGTAAESTLESGDEFLFYDTSASALKKVTKANLLSGLELHVKEEITISPAQATGKSVTLSETPTENAAVAMWVAGGTSQRNGTDFTVTGSVISWSGSDLDGVLDSGDVLIFTYDKAAS